MKLFDQAFPATRASLSPPIPFSCPWIISYLECIGQGIAILRKLCGSRSCTSYCSNKIFRSVVYLRCTRATWGGNKGSRLQWERIPRIWKGKFHWKWGHNWRNTSDCSFIYLEHELKRKKYNKLTIQRENEL